MKFYFKNAFTLTEVMITLTVIGIITAVIIPVAVHSKPDENVMKFKKANNTLYQAISTLVNSDEYYLNGDLGKYPDGSWVDETTATNQAYLCNTLKNVLSTKNDTCETGFNVLCGKTAAAVPEDAGLYQTTNNTLVTTYFSQTLDDYCKTADTGCSTNLKTVTTTDNITYYETSHKYPFGYSWSKAMNKNNTYRETGIRKFYHTWDHQGLEDLVNYDNGKGFYYFYKVICIDVDGIGKGEDPFGYGIRVDGKIMPGKRATEWLTKSIQGES